MKIVNILFLAVILSIQNSFSKLSVIDSIISIQSDSLVQTKLIKFKAGGVERKLETGFITPDSLVFSAIKYLETPHCMGGNGKTTKNSKGTSCIDCSGLLYASFLDLGIIINVHSSQEMAHYGKIIADTSQIQNGDVLFYIKSYNSKNPEIVITHSAIAIGKGRMIHTSASNGVEIIPINTGYWSSRFIFATRIF
jgi:murein DD-endopeptidase / murein LD-carboxypeptidase